MAFGVRARRPQAPAGALSAHSEASSQGALVKFAFPLPHMLRLKAITQHWEAGVTGADQTRIVKRAEAMGYDMIAIPEHFAIPVEHVELSGPHYLQSTIAQAYIAGATEEIRLNSCVTVLPLQHPIALAKADVTNRR